MRRLWRIAAVLMLTAFSFLLAPQSACACSCAVGTQAEFFENADFIFIGVVTAVDKPFMIGGGGGGEVKVDFVVEQVTKGESAGRITLTTADGGASCGYDFSAGQRYKVFARGGTTGLCSGNELVGSAPEVPIDKPFPIGMVAVGGGVLIAGLAAYVLHRRRKL